MSHRAHKNLVQPVAAIFALLQKQAKIQVWIYEQTNIRIEGVLRGFDEYMNMVLENATEINIKTKQRIELGLIMLKGDNITLIAKAV